MGSTDSNHVEPDMLKIIRDRKAKARQQERAEQEKLELASLALKRRVQALFQATQQAA